MQYIADVFWSRWRKEYIPLLLQRQKWTVERRSHSVGDLVFVVDQLLPRNMCCLSRIVSVKPDSRGNVHSAEVKVVRYKQGNNLKFGPALLSRPISKLVLLRAIEDM